jgi:hypothetical protein
LQDWVPAAGWPFDRRLHAGIFSLRQYATQNPAMNSSNFAVLN